MRSLAEAEALEAALKQLELCTSRHFWCRLAWMKAQGWVGSASSGCWKLALQT